MSESALGFMLSETLPHDSLHIPKENDGKCHTQELESTTLGCKTSSEMIDFISLIFD